MQKVKLTYFKESGKYYSEGEFETEHPEYHDWLIIADIKRMVKAGKLPGLIQGCTEFHILMSGETVVPALILKNSWLTEL